MMLSSKRKLRRPFGMGQMGDKGGDNMTSYNIHMHQSHNVIAILMVSI